MATTVIEHGDRIEVVTGGRVWMLDRDRLETAWLAWLEQPIAVRLAVVLRDRHGFVGDSIRYAFAADALHRANILI